MPWPGHGSDLMSKLYSLRITSWSEVRSLERAPSQEIQNCKLLVNYRNKGNIGKKKIPPTAGAQKGKQARMSWAPFYYRRQEVACRWVIGELEN